MKIHTPKLNPVKICLWCLIVMLVVEASHAQMKTICVTIDDLPAVTRDTSLNSWKYVTNQLTQTLKRYNIPAIGFVNEGKLVENDKSSKAKEALLYAWYDSGLELGNHTYSHMNFNTSSLAEYEEDVLKGEKFTNNLYPVQTKRIKYFRHPYLHVGNTSDKKSGLHKVLAKHRYVEAPVTIDNADYIFSSAYDHAVEINDTIAARRVGEEYIPYMMAKVQYYEQQSLQLFQKEIAQILILHANNINAKYMVQLISELDKAGYRFASLTETLKDPLYRTLDNYVGTAGISWIHRWAITQKKTKEFFGTEPRVSEFVMKLSGFKRE